MAGEAKVEVIEPRNFAGDVADELVSLIGEAIADRGVCRIALSGGTTPGVVYRALGHPPRVNEVAWDKVVLFWGDERYVSHEDTQSNYNMVRETMLAGLRVQPQVHPVPTDLANPEDAAKQYEAVLREELGGGDSTFDIVLLGLGDDGHTASLFPHSALLHEGADRWVAVSINPKDDTTRITIMPRALMAGRRIMFLVSGQSKADVAHRVVKGVGSVDEYPALLFREVAEKVTWYLDSGAARKLQETPR
jgi:6-phosphogluconolactonase